MIKWESWGRKYEQIVKRLKFAERYEQLYYKILKINLYYDILYVSKKGEKKKDQGRRTSVS